MERDSRLEFKQWKFTRKIWNLRRLENLRMNIHRQDFRSKKIPVLKSNFFKIQMKLKS